MCKNLSDVYKNRPFSLLGDGSLQELELRNYTLVTMQT
jgi:hypothetical protein